jgi:hypothetical protein
MPPTAVTAARLWLQNLLYLFEIYVEIFAREDS